MFEEIISLENLCAAWREFLVGKKSKRDVASFSLDLSRNLLALHKDLKNKTYVHGRYQAFNISDPKPRNIHKATVRDRVFHHAIYRVLYPYFDKKFIFDSYSCRDKKGTHKAINRFRQFGYKVSRNNTRTCWILKCDIRKFFASIDQEVLLSILRKHIQDEEVLWLLGEVIGSFHTDRISRIARNDIAQGAMLKHSTLGRGLPLGNLTSQLLVNIYMNEFDKFVKHGLRARYYLRYADDFVFMSASETELDSLILKIKEFLETRLKLTLHPDKVFIKTLASGVDFLGWVHFPDHRVLRTTTKRRMLARIKQHPTESTLASYRGMLHHGNTNKLAERILRSPAGGL